MVIGISWCGSRVEVVFSRWADGCQFDRLYTV